MSVLSLAALAMLVRAGITHDLDRALLRAVQSGANGAFDLIANLHTIAGLPYVTVPLAGAWSYALWRRGHGAASLAPLLVGATVPIELALKLTTGHTPPGPDTSRAFLQLVPALDTPSSFPSGHAARLTFLAVLASLLVRQHGRSEARPARRSAPLAAAAFIAFTLVARVYIGDHWPTDVVGGAALGLAFAFIAAAWIRGAATRGELGRQSAASKSSLARRK